MAHSSAPRTSDVPSTGNVGHTGSGGGHHHEHHVLPLPLYYKVFGALIVLTVVTVLAAQVDFGAFNAVVAFGIATVKATLVAAFFMHLKYDNMMNRVILVSGVFFLIVLYLFCWVDEATRTIVVPS